MATTIGIDLGTTNACVAVCEAGQPQVISNAEGQATTPSVVAFRDNGDVLVGQAARRQAVANAASTIYAIKRFMGRRFASPPVAAERAAMPYAVVPDAAGNACVLVHGRTHLPAEVSSLILARMKQLAEDYLGTPVQRAVVAVPAYFDADQRQATRDAGSLAGLEVVQIINEPTAAALACRVRHAAARKVAVYDLGGGTFDVSILDVGPDAFEVIAAHGDSHLGGEDFDNIIIEALCADFEAVQGIDLRRDRGAMQRLKQAAERLKHTLSEAQEAEVNLPFISSDKAGAKHLTFSMRRSQLEALCEPLIERSMAPCRRALQEAGLQVGDLDDVLLVGGMTRTPRIVARVRDFFARAPNSSLNPEEVVALGAAVRAANLDAAAPQQA